MKTTKQFWRTLLFFVLLAALCGSFAFPVVNLPLNVGAQGACSGTVIAAWEFTGDSLVPTRGTTGVFSSGAGLTGPTFLSGPTTGQNPSISFNDWTITTDIDDLDYIEFQLSTLARNNISLDFDSRISTTGPASFQIRYSLDGTTFTQFGSPINSDTGGNWDHHQIDLKSETRLNNATNISIRLYGYKASDASGTWRIDNVVFSGICVDYLTSTAISNQTGTGQANLTATAISGLTSTAAAKFTATATLTKAPAPVVPRAVIINEIAWSGTKASVDDEWIELYNTTDSSIPLTNWILRSDDNSPIISLTGLTIKAKGYLLLARNPGTFKGVTPDYIYGDSNSTYNLSEQAGEVLRLTNASTTVIDTANDYFGFRYFKWAAGSLTPNRASMERRDTFAITAASWFTFAGTPPNGISDRSGNPIYGTPGRPNWAITVTATPTRRATSFPSIPTRTLTPPPPPPLVAINEFVPRPGRDWNNDGVVNVEDEYIELLNHGTVNVNLSGYSLDDEVNIGSSPFRLPAVTLKPGERAVFYGSDTGLLLSDGGDGVRLLRPNGQLMDAYNYFVVGHPDQSYCRLPDDGGADDWNKNCFPTPGLKNSLSGSAARPSTGVNVELFCPIADTLPDDFALAECDPFGNNIWNPAFWDKLGWYEERYLPETNGKWPVFAD